MSQKVKAKGLYLEITKGEYLFINTKLGKSFWINPKNVEGSFENGCQATVFLINGEPHAKIDEKKKETGIEGNKKKIKYQKDGTYLISW